MKAEELNFHVLFYNYGKAVVLNPLPYYCEW